MKLPFGLEITTKETRKDIRLSDLKQLYKRLKKYSNHYDGAATNRTRTDWTTSKDTPYRNINGNLSKLIARSQYAYDNDPVFKAAVNSIVNNVLCTGMRPQPMVEKANGELNERLNEVILSKWDRYNDEWDRRNLITFYEAQRLALRTIIVSGGVLTNSVESLKGSLIPIAKQMIEPSRLDTSFDDEKVTETENEPFKQTLHGINLDKFGKEVSFWIAGINRPISSQYMHHTFLIERPEQYIGVPWASAALDTLWDVHQLHEDQLVKSRALADIVWWEESSNDTWKNADNKDDDENGILEALTFMRSKSKPEVIQADDKINETINPLVKAILHPALSALGSSYMTVTKDMEGVNFAASRAVMLEERRGFAAIQKWFAKAFCQKEWNDFIYWLVFTDQIPGITLDMYLRNAYKYNQVWFKPEGWDWVDPQKDANADISFKNAGLQSDQDILAKKGKSVESVYKQIAKERDLRKQLKIGEYGDAIQTELQLDKGANDETE
jgi:lambda family phage portal protein